jgi:hypothetical protein
MEKTKSPQRSETMVGWISRNSCQGPVKAELFFLTSLFIELIAPDFLANIWRKLVQTPGYNSYAAGASRYDDHVCFALLPGESREVRNHALPSTILLHKYICRPFLSAEALSHEFALCFSQSGDDSRIPVDSHPKIFGFHRVVAQGP